MNIYEVFEKLAAEIAEVHDLKYGCSKNKDFYNLRVEFYDPSNDYSVGWTVSEKTLKTAPNMHDYIKEGMEYAIQPILNHREKGEQT